jgi:hypothetical protein
MPAVSRLVSGEPAAAGRPLLVIADATYTGMFRVRIADGTTSDMMNHARAVDTARLWAATPPVRRKPSRALSSAPPADAPTARPLHVLVITVSPSTGANGPRAYSSRGPLFDGEVDGQVVVARSPTPFCDGARRLLDLGHDGNAVLVMKHASSDVVALKAGLATAAGLTVGENRGASQFVPYRQMPARLDAVTPPMRQGDQPVQRRFDDPSAPGELHAAEGAR